MRYDPSSTDIEERLGLANLVAATFPDWLLASTHVVWAESMGDWAGRGWRCNVYGPCVSPTCDRGLFQINCIWAETMNALGFDFYVDVFIPEKNIQMARLIFDWSGPCAWTTAC